MTLGHPQIHERYRVDSGNRLPKHGVTDYSVITDSGSGFSFMEQGNHLMTADGTSHESFGHNLQGGSEVFQPAKWIKAESGDIFFEAPQGTIYLKAKNIVMQASAADPDGNIFMVAPNDIYIKSSDTVTVDATNINVVGKKTLNLIGQSFTNIASNFVSMADTTDILSSITSLDARISDVLKLMIGA